MRRFSVQINDRTANLYYRTPEDAKLAFPTATITEIKDSRHLPAIKAMIDSAVKAIDVQRGEDIRTYMLFETPFGQCEAMISRDSNDGKFYDYCQYRLHKCHRTVEPVCWDVSTPIEFVSKFISPEPISFEVLCSSPNVSKPVELKGAAPITNIKYGGRACQVFVKGDDVYIKHGDYFSPCVSALSSSDGKGHIYIRVAWLKISNLIPAMSHLNAVQISGLIWEKICAYHRWGKHERNTEWRIFGEQLANEIKKHFNHEEEYDGKVLFHKTYSRRKQAPQAI